MRDCLSIRARKSSTLAPGPRHRLSGRVRARSPDIAGASPARVILRKGRYVSTVRTQSAFPTDVAKTHDEP